MSEMWRDWEGQVADHKYQLRQFLGSTDHSVVFLAEYHDPEPRKAAIKFLAGDTPNAEQQLAAWKSTAEVQHPSLLPLYGCGRCRIADTDLLYVAMEYADEHLGQVLPQRALTREEAREVLNAVVEVLVFLHGKGLTHGHIKPSNVLAAGDRLKLSSDTIQAAEKVREMNRKRSAYDAPEIPASPYARAADVWSLGVMLVEALTQQPAILPFNEKADPVIPPSVPEPFFGIADYALRRNPEARATSTQIAERLNLTTSTEKPAAADAREPKTIETAAAATVPPMAAAAAATASAGGQTPVANQSAPSPTVQASTTAEASAAAAPMPMPAPATLAVSPLEVPLSKEPVLPPEKRVRASAQYPPVSRPRMLAVPRESGEQRQSITLPNYVVPLFAAVLVLILIFALPKILRRRTQAPAPIATNTTANAPKASTPDVTSSTPNTAKPPVKAAPPKPAPSDSGTSTVKSGPVAPPPTSNNAPEFKASRSALGRGEVLDQVLPEVPGKALSTIQGTVRVVVKANVNASGRVSEAVLDSAGPSRYFADKALAAARQWTFSTPVVGGRSESTAWLIRFEFTREGVNAYPSQVTP